MGTANLDEPGAGSYLAQIYEQIRLKGNQPMTSADELKADVFESDDELYEFLADLQAFRHEHMCPGVGGD